MENLASPFGLEGGDVRCLQALWTLSDIEFDRLPLGERPVPVSLNRGEVHENILTGLALDESESLAGIEPLYCSLFFHLFVPSFCLSYLVRLEPPSAEYKKGLQVVLDSQPL
jgi:hypothetical protein